MIIGVISDTHINRKSITLPAAVSEAFKGVDMIVHAGDLVDLSVLDALRSICKEVKSVWGNMDPNQVRAKLPEKEIISAGRFKIGLMHGRGNPACLVELLTQEFKDDSVDLIIFGHSHSPFNEKIGDVLFFNPGSATDKIFAPYNSVGIIEAGDKLKARIVKI
ncbi:metallophosphoesterase family protein [Candidatus Omnitrophota bacterium]